MKTTMRLKKEPFDAILCKDKTVEMRLFDEKRRTVSKGDEIEFVCEENGRKMSAIVADMHILGDFAELYASLPAVAIGYKGREESADYRDMYAYYREEDIKKYGVVGIELSEVRAER